MAEIVNNNVIETGKKFVDLSGLDYFWGKAKGYIDEIDGGFKTRLDAIDGESGRLAGIEGTLAALGTGAGSIQSQIQNAIDALKLAETYDSKGSAAQALADAKTYVDGKVDGKFDATGSAAQALADAKTYADGLNTDMSERVDGVVDRLVELEAIDHEKLAQDAAASAVATIRDDAPEAFDTLKEIAEWIASSETSAEAANLVTRVSTLEGEMDDVEGRLDVLEAIDHDAYISADETVLADAKSYVDGKVDGKFDATGSAAQALTDAKAYVDGKVDGKFDAVGSAAQALTDAKAYVDDMKIADAIAAAKAAAIKDADDKLALKANAADVFTKTEVNNLLSTNSAADQAYAKTYTDALFNSIKFAEDSEIDGLFA